MPSGDRGRLGPGGGGGGCWKTGRERCPERSRLAAWLRRSGARRRTGRIRSAITAPLSAGRDRAGRLGGRGGHRGDSSLNCGLAVDRDVAQGGRDTGGRPPEMSSPALTADGQLDSLHPRPIPMCTATASAMPAPIARVGSASKTVMQKTFDGAKTVAKVPVRVVRYSVIGAKDVVVDIGVGAKDVGASVVHHVRSI